MTFSPRLRQLLLRHLEPEGYPTSLTDVRPVGGGSINTAFQLRFSTGRPLFCKLNSATKFPHLFRRESEGLQLLASAGCIRLPEVRGVLETDDTQCLLLEWIEKGRESNAFWESFGRQLAALHRVAGTHYGWERSNYMGSLMQDNTGHTDWVGFWIERRLRPLLTQCIQQGLLDAHWLHRLDAVRQRMETLFASEPPCLVHGDLWSGNYLCAADGQPVLIDPAPYFGHRSVDLAMTTLFGGFAPRFYAAYAETYPLPDQYEMQWTACNLYPLLVHLLLFGGSYRAAVVSGLNELSR